MISGLPFLNPTATRISIPTMTSWTDDPVRDPKMLSPIPSASSAPIPTADFMTPGRPAPVSVTPTWRGYGNLRAAALYASIVADTVEDFSERTMSLNPISSRVSTLRLALSTMAAAVGPPAASSTSLSSEPEFTPILRGTPLPIASRATVFSRSRPPILPGFILSLSAPASSARRARR
jgi:hypothetical protein